MSVTGPILTSFIDKKKSDKDLISSTGTSGFDYTIKSKHLEMRLSRGSTKRDSRDS